MIIKDFQNDLNFKNEYIETGKIPNEILNKNNIYNIIKINEVPFEKIDKQIIKNLIIKSLFPLNLKKKKPLFRLEKIIIEKNNNKNKNFSEDSRSKELEKAKSNNSSDDIKNIEFIKPIDIFEHFNQEEEFDVSIYFS